VTLSPAGRVTLPPGRRAVLYALRRRGEAGVEELAEQLQMTHSGVRQHLNVLSEEGLVEAVEEDPPSPRRGRRTLRYSVTPEADHLFPKAYGELTNELLGYLDDADPTLLASLFERRREHRIAGARAHLEPLDGLGARVAELARILDADGYLAGVEEIAGGYLIVERNCAIWAVAQRYGHACVSELEFIQAALPEAEVRRVAHLVAGARQCAYEVTPRVAAG